MWTNTKFYLCSILVTNFELDLGALDYQISPITTGIISRHSYHIVSADLPAKDTKHKIRERTQMVTLYLYLTRSNHTKASSLNHWWMHTNIRPCLLDTEQDFYVVGAQRELPRFSPECKIEIPQNVTDKMHNAKRPLKCCHWIYLSPRHRQAQYRCRRQNSPQPKNICRGVPAQFSTQFG